MEPLEGAAELAADAVELREPELRLEDPASPGEEQADVEAADAPGGGRCWPCGAWVCGGSPGDPGPKGQRLFLLLRGLFGSCAMILMYYAFQTTSLADATVIAFSCPVFTSIFAWIFLKEKYSLWDALFMLFALVGVILIVRPPFLFGSDTSGMNKSYSEHIKGTFAAIGHAVLAAMTLVILRKMGKSVDYFLSIWYYVILGLPECAVILFIIGGWSIPYCGLDRLFLILIGLLGLGGQIFITKAVQIEKAGLVAIMKTMDIVFAFIFQIAFFDNMPTWWTVGGALCVVASTTGATIRRWIQSSTVQQ
ncbi:solute carrier family 35 member G1 [Cricetulus griseus]